MAILSVLFSIFDHDVLGISCNFQALRVFFFNVDDPWAERLHGFFFIRTMFFRLNLGVLKF